MKEIMNDNKTLATPETRNSLYDNMGKTIEHFSPLLKEGIILKEIQINPTGFNTNSALPSLTNKINLMAVGIKVRLALGSK